jgi:hypothetical protein
LDTLDLKGLRTAVIEGIGVFALGAQVTILFTVITHQLASIASHSGSPAHPLSSLFCNVALEHGYAQGLAGKKVARIM